MRSWPIFLGILHVNSLYLNQNFVMKVIVFIGLLTEYGQIYDQRILKFGRK